MVKIQATCSITGDNFSPSTFERMNKIPLVDGICSGEIYKKGILKGRPASTGSASIEVSDKAESDWKYVDKLLDVVEKCDVHLREAGADELNFFTSMFHDGECNFSFSKEQLIRMAKMGFSLSISCYNDSLLHDDSK